jgi:hypothetical protein
MSNTNTAFDTAFANTAPTRYASVSPEGQVVIKTYANRSSAQRQANKFNRQAIAAGDWMPCHEVGIGWFIELVPIHNPSNI